MGVAKNTILPAYLVGSGLKLIENMNIGSIAGDSPGLFSREWIETALPALTANTPATFSRLI